MQTIGTDVVLIDGIVFLLSLVLFSNVIFDVVEIYPVAAVLFLVSLLLLPLWLYLLLLLM